MNQPSKRSQDLMSQLQQQATKLDKDLTAKEAKLQNLQQAISLAEQKQQSLDTKLKNYELDKRKAIDDNLLIGEAKIGAIQETVEELNSEKLELEKYITTLQSNIAELQTITQSLEAEIIGLNSKKDGLQKAIDDLKLEQHILIDEVADLKGGIVELNAKKDGIHADIKTVSDKSIIARLSLDNLEFDYNTLKAKKEDELNAILQKTSDCLTRLQQFEAEEREKRASLAKDIMAMEKERESLLILKAQSSNLESQIAKKKQLMKL